jgi:hypothetical protein
MDRCQHWHTPPTITAAGLLIVLEVACDKHVQLPHPSCLLMLIMLVAVLGIKQFAVTLMVNFMMP